MSTYDLIIKDVHVVRPGVEETPHADIAVTGGRVARVAPGLAAADATEVVAGRGRLAFPGSSTPTSTGASTTRSPRTR